MGAGVTSCANVDVIDACKVARSSSGICSPAMVVNKGLEEEEAMVGMVVDGSMIEGSRGQWSKDRGVNGRGIEGSMVKVKGSRGRVVNEKKIVLCYQCNRKESDSSRKYDKKGIKR